MFAPDGSGWRGGGPKTTTPRRGFRRLRGAGDIPAGTARLSQLHENDGFQRGTRADNPEMAGQSGAIMQHDYQHNGGDPQKRI